MDIPLFVCKHYEMDPETEDLLFDATQLANGLTVLIETPDLRVFPEHTDSLPERERALRWNRWMTISDLTIDEVADEVLFIATYEDGTKKKITTSADYAWYVKKDSLEAVEALRLNTIVEVAAYAENDVTETRKISNARVHEIVIGSGVVVGVSPDHPLAQNLV